MEIEIIIDAINEHQYNRGKESGYQKSQLRYTEIVDTGENIIHVETRAYTNDTKELEFSVVTEKGKVIAINEIN
ncbi:hypothetical protein [Enterococcus sp. AZ196]|uniref:hypothetical protein n=1 Tax=Enterococcus sp. AZ196 TaxID=2774659 RepID=UPI003D26B890